jgi:hypothetical protein
MNLQEFRDLSREGPEAILKRVEFFVEAGYFESHLLWAENDREKRVKWEPCLLSWVLNVGQFHEYPVTVDVRFALLNGCLICFYEGASMVVKHDMIRQWFEDEGYQPTWDGNRPAFVDGWNFGHCLQYCYDNYRS